MWSAKPPVVSFCARIVWPSGLVKLNETFASILKYLWLWGRCRVDHQALNREALGRQLWVNVRAIDERTKMANGGAGL